MSDSHSSRVDFLLKRLADGKFHSGEVIANELGISRAAVWKLIQKLESWQLKVFSVRGRGYQIPGGLDLLVQEKLQQRLHQSNSLIKQAKVLISVDSTSDHLAKDWRKQPGEGRVCVAEHQMAGRGRKGRPWVSPFAANLYFSIGLQLPLGLSALGGLSLMVGISLSRTLNRLTAGQVKIKWPNDLWVDNKKLAGILVEASGESNDSSFLNIGVGINWAMQAEQGSDIDQAWANLQPLLAKQVSRDDVLAALLIDLDASLIEFQATGFHSFLVDWPKLSALYQQPVSIILPRDRVEGKEIGVEPSGALRLQTPQGERSFHSGEVSLRKSLAGYNQ